MPAPMKVETPTAYAIKGMLIDMDGTLVDHLETLVRCFQYATRQLGLPQPSHERVKRSIGGSMPVTMRKFVPEEHAEEAVRLWQAHFDEIYLEDFVVLPGADELLALRAKHGIKAAVLTNKTGDHTRAMLSKQGLSDRLDFALGTKDTPYRKPQVPFSEAALERLGLPAQNVAMIGDSPFDIQAATCVGMIPLCVATGSHTAEELLAAGAHQVFDDLAQVADWIERHL